MRIRRRKESDALLVIHRGRAYSALQVVQKCGMMEKVSVLFTILLESISKGYMAIQTQLHGEKKACYERKLQHVYPLK